MKKSYYEAHISFIASKEQINSISESYFARKCFWVKMVLEKNNFSAFFYIQVWAKNCRVPGVPDQIIPTSVYCLHDHSKGPRTARSIPSCMYGR